MTFLVLSLLEEYARAFEGLWELLEPGGRFLVVDVHAERLGFQGRMVNLTARADEGLKRRPSVRQHEKGLLSCERRPHGRVGSCTDTA